MRTVLAIGFALAFLAAGATSAPAQEAGGINYPELFQQLDANGDMVVERGEVPESGRAAFDTLLKNADRNKDGKIDREEYRDMLVSLREAFSLRNRFAEVDKDGDGKISKGEFAGPGPLFARIDADGDGFISREEAAKFQPGQGAGAGMAASMFAQRLRAMDKDGDGKVSKDEFTGQPAVFDRLDVNKDGVLSPDEIPGAAAGGGPAGVPGRGPGGPAGEPPKAATGAGAGAGVGERFRAMDKDKDGKLSREELAAPPAFFDRLDADGDGFITPREVARQGVRNPAPSGPGSFADRLRAMDKDGDGKVSKDEFTGRPEVFDRLDANKDGFVTPDEMSQRRPEPGKARNPRRPAGDKV